MNAIAMKSTGLWTAAVVLILVHACAGLTSADEPGQTARPAVDVALDAGGHLQGMLLDTHGKPLPNEPIILHIKPTAARTAVTDQQGRFQFADLQGGVTVLAYQNQANMFRIWKHTTAPPKAQNMALIYSTNVVRGQGCGACGGAGCGACGGGYGMGPVAPQGHGQAPGAGRFGGIKLPSFHPIQALKNPWTIGVLIGGAVAIPIALHDDEVPLDLNPGTGPPAS